jgi:hypothetical protein
MDGMSAPGVGNNRWLSKGQLAKTKATQVANIRQVIEDFGGDIAPRNLAPKGCDKVAFRSIDRR